MHRANLIRLSFSASCRAAPFLVAVAFLLAGRGALAANGLPLAQPWPLIAGGAGLGVVVLLLWRVTRRRRAVQDQDDEAIENEAFMRRLIDSLPAFIAYVDRDLRYRFTSRHYETQFTVDRAELVGRPVADLLGERHFAEVEPLLRRALAGQPVSYFDRLSFPDRGLRDLAVELVPNLINGLVAGFFVIAKDVTGLRRLEQQLGQFFELSQDLFCVAGTDGYLKRVNPAFEAALGYTGEELQSRPFLDFVHSQDKQRTREAHATVIRGETLRDFENRYVRKDGTVRWLQWRSSGANDEGLIFAVARDVTERRQAQLAAREREQRLNSILRAAPVGIGFLVEGRFQQVNQRLCELTGYDEATLLGRSSREIFPSDGDRRWMGERHFRQLSEAGSATMEAWVRRSNGQLVPTLLSSAPVDVTNPERGVTLTVQDITHRKRTERQTERLLAENRALAKRNMEIQEAERKTIAQELHDELGQGLTAIRADAEAVIAKIGDRDPTIVESARAIAHVAERVYETTHAIMRSMRPPLLDEAGLATSLGMTVGEWQRGHPEVRCDITIEGDIDDLSDTTNVTAYRLVQEALTNIAKYAGADRVHITLERIADSVDRPDSVLLRIEDDGRGFDPTDTMDGLGVLGMRERVLAANGRFALRTSPGRGVTISAELPVRQD
jgi:PAS domain S-box-containing protein